MRKVENLIDKYRAYISQHQFDQAPENLYTPINYILQQGGKRLRPALVMLGAQLYGDPERPEVYAAATAVEIFHNFTLVHDDIMDEALLRRGQDTVHSKYGLSAAILSGDVMCIYAYEYLSRAGGQDQISALLGAFNRMAIEVCAGQQYDMDFEKRNDVLIEEYLNMVELKTAALLGGCLEIGALVNGASVADAVQLQAYGRKLGIAFQVQDDLLDTFGQKAQVGKRIGGDIIQNKKTFLILEAMRRADAQQKKTLTFWYNQSPEDPSQKVKEVTQLFETLGLQKWARELQAKYEEQARDHLRPLVLSKEAELSLLSIADILLRREA